MNTYYIFALCYLFGTVIGSFLLITNDGKKITRGDSFLIVGLLLLTFLFDGLTTPGEKVPLLMPCTLFSIFFGIACKDRILPKISNFTCLYFSLLFWCYFIYGSLYRDNFYIVLGYIAAIPTLLVFWISFNPRDVGNTGRILSYFWYMSLMAFFGWINLRGEYVIYFSDRHDATHLNWIGMFFSGMTMNFTLIMLANMFNMIPIPIMQKNFKERLKSWHNDISLLESKTFITRVPFLREGIVAGLIFLAFCVNDRWGTWPASSVAVTLVMALPIAYAIAYRRIRS